MQSTKGQVDSFVKENKGLKTKVKSLEEQLLESKKEVEEFDERHNDIEARHDKLEQYTQKFNLVIHGIPEHEEEDNVANVVTLKTSASEFNTRRHRYCATLMFECYVCF